MAPWTEYEPARQRHRPDQQGGPVSDQQASEPAIRAADATRRGCPRPPAAARPRQVRHTARTRLHVRGGRRGRCWRTPTSCARRRATTWAESRRPRRRSSPKPGRRSGFKVWKTPFWKRRRSHVGGPERRHPPHRRGGVARPQSSAGSKSSAKRVHAVALTRRLPARHRRRDRGGRRIAGSAPRSAAMPWLRSSISSTASATAGS